MITKRQRKDQGLLRHKPCKHTDTVPALKSAQGRYQANNTGKANYIIPLNPQCGIWCILRNQSCQRLVKNMAIVCSRLHGNYNKHKIVKTAKQFGGCSSRFCCFYCLRPAWLYVYQLISTSLSSQHITLETLSFPSALQGALQLHWCYD